LKLTQLISNNRVNFKLIQLICINSIHSKINSDDFEANHGSWLMSFIQNKCLVVRPVLKGPENRKYISKIGQAPLQMQFCTPHYHLKSRPLWIYSGYVKSYFSAKQLFELEFISLFQMSGIHLVYGQIVFCKFFKIDCNWQR